MKLKDLSCKHFQQICHLNVQLPSSLRWTQSSQESHKYRRAPSQRNICSFREGVKPCPHSHLNCCEMFLKFLKVKTKSSKNIAWQLFFSFTVGFLYQSLFFLFHYYCFWYWKSKSKKSQSHHCCYSLRAPLPQLQVMISLFEIELLNQWMLL